MLPPKLPRRSTIHPTRPMRSAALIAFRRIGRTASRQGPDDCTKRPLRTQSCQGRRAEAAQRPSIHTPAVVRASSRLAGNSSRGRRASAMRARSRGSGPEGVAALLAASTTCDRKLDQSMACLLTDYISIVIKRASRWARVASGFAGAGVELSALLTVSSPRRRWYRAQRRTEEEQLPEVALRVAQRVGVLEPLTEREIEIGAIRVDRVVERTPGHWIGGLQHLIAGGVAQACRDRGTVPTAERGCEAVLRSTTSTTSINFHNLQDFDVLQLPTATPATTPRRPQPHGHGFYRETV
jgi:hypothetical protein